MQIKEFLLNAEIKAAKERLEGLKKYEAPGIMITRQAEIIEELEAGTFKVSGDNTLLETEFSGYEVKKGNGGKTYIVFDNKIKYFPRAKFGRFITI